MGVYVDHRRSKRRHNHWVQEWSWPDIWSEEVEAENILSIRLTHHCDGSLILDHKHHVMMLPKSFRSIFTTMKEWSPKRYQSWSSLKKAKLQTGCSVFTLFDKWNSTRLRIHSILPEPVKWISNSGALEGSSTCQSFCIGQLENIWKSIVIPSMLKNVQWICGNPSSAGGNLLAQKISQDNQQS